MGKIYFNIFSVFAIFLVGAAVYSNTFHCGFHFDDDFFIKNNFAIRHIDSIKEIWDFLPARFIFYLSLAVNYHFHQLDLFGYHAVNLTVHIISSILVWWLCLLTLSTPAVKGLLEKTVGKNKSPSRLKHRNSVAPLREITISDHAPVIALFAGLIFVSHPIQTQAITYIMQRAASMATMFYLAAVCFYVQSRLLFNENSSSLAGKVCYVVSLLAAVLAMYTKEITITLPAAILLYEFYFLRVRQKINWKFLIPVLLTITVIPLTLSMTKAINSAEMKNVTEGVGDISAAQYAITQMRVFITYLRLIILPFNQNLDYDYPVSQSLFELPTFLSFLFLVGVLGGAQRLFSKYRILSFSILWFYLTLLPESSFFPMKDVIFEHRLYLPMAGVSLFLACGAYYLLGKKIMPAMIAILILFIGINAVLTYQRNKVWENEFTLWDDIVHKSPHKARPYLNRGLSYFLKNDFDRALADYNKAVSFDPNYEMAYNNRGIVYKEQGHLTEALSDFNKSIAIEPNSSEPYANRGAVLIKLEKYDQALADFNKALEGNPYNAKGYNYRGVTYAKKGDSTKALADLTKSIEMDAYDPESYTNRGNIYNKKGMYADALADFNKAIEVNPLYSEAYSNRGALYANQGDFQKALEEYNKAIEINPKSADAYNNRGYVFAKLNNAIRTIEDLSKSIEIDPQNALAHSNRGLMYFNQGKMKEAIADFNKAIEIDPKYADAYYNRGNAYYRINDLPKAIEDYTKAIDFNPQYTSAYTNRATVYGRQGKFPEAIADYNKSIELNPKFAPAFEYRAVSYYNLKQYQKAWDDVHQVERLGAAVNPEFIKVLKNASIQGI